jgi:tetratricopeptide (TPR) repeat protein
MDIEKKPNAPLLRKQFFARLEEASWWIPPILGLCFLAGAAGGIWNNLANLGTRGPWSVLGLLLAIVICCISIRILTTGLLQLILQRRWQAKHFDLIAAFLSRAVAIVGRLPLCGGADQANIEYQLGLKYMYEGFFESAEPLFSTAINRLTKAIDYAPKESRAESIPFYSVLVTSLTIVCFRQKKYAEATAHAKGGLEELPKLFKSSDKKGYELCQALLLLTLGSIHLRQNELDVAEEYFSKTMNLCEFPPPTTSFRRATSFFETLRQQMRISLNLHMTLLYVRKNDVEKSQRKFDALITEATQGIDKVSPLAIENLCIVAGEYISRGLLPEAETALGLAYSVCKERQISLDSELVLTRFEELLLLTGRQSELAELRSGLPQIRRQ